ncbi:MAG: hypothetical protein HGB05_12875 [Chloroflexi bacterium]|nr:hypothetical protein [Chloroflexota bacterium]
MATLILSMLLLLALGLVMVAYAQGPDGGREPEAGGIDGEGLADPPPEGFTVLYTFTGARDTQGNVPNSGATAVLCTNAGAANVQVRVEISDWDNAPTISGTLSIPPSGTRTYTSQNTNLYDEDFTMIYPTPTDNINQGSGRVLANSSSANVICTAQVLDPVGNPPTYAVKLTLYDGSGNIVGSIRKIFLPLILRL